MNFDDELGRVLDQLAEHLREEVSGRLQAAMPALQAVAQSERDAAATEAAERARVEAERDSAEHLDAVRREAAEQLESAKHEAAARLESAQREAAEQVESARREAAEQLESAKREAAEQLELARRDAAEQMDSVQREAVERVEFAQREGVERVEAAQRQAADRLAASEQLATEQLANARLDHEEQFSSLQRETTDQVAARERELAERLELAESAIAQRLAGTTADAESRAHNAGRSAGRNEGRRALAEAFLALSRARTLSEVLDTLGTAAQRETASVAVLLVRGNYVRTWKLSGFGEATDGADPFDIALSDAGVIREAVQSAALVCADSSQERAFPAFAAPMGPGASEGSEGTEEMTRALAAAPLVVGGQVVAVLYGDGPDPGEQGQLGEKDLSWQTAFDALASYASRLLEAMTAFRTATLLTTGTGQRKGNGAEVRAEG